MSNELIGILGVGAALLGVGVALASFIVTGLRGFEKRLGARMDSLERRVDALETKTEDWLRALETKLEGRLDALDTRMAVVERGLAKLEGLMEGMRDALFGTRRASNL